MKAIEVFAAEQKIVMSSAFEKNAYEKRRKKKKRDFGKPLSLPFWKNARLLRYR